MHYGKSLSRVGICQWDIRSPVMTDQRSVLTLPPIGRVPATGRWIPPKGAVRAFRRELIDQVYGQEQRLSNARINFIFMPSPACSHQCALNSSPCATTHRARCRGQRRSMASLLHRRLSCKINGLKVRSGTWTAAGSACAKPCGPGAPVLASRPDRTRFKRMMGRVAAG